MPQNDFNLIRKYAKTCKTNDRFKQIMLSLNVIGKEDNHMTDVTLDAYWSYYNDLTRVEQSMRDVSRFVHGYVSKHIQDKLFS